MAETLKNMKEAAQGRGGTTFISERFRTASLTRLSQVACSQLRPRSEIRLLRMSTRGVAVRRRRTRLRLRWVNSRVRLYPLDIGVVANELGTGAPTTESTSVGADQQAANQQSGTADHLELGMRKKT